MNKDIKLWNRYKPLCQQLVIRDLKVKYRRSFLGYLWSLLNPLLMMLVMTVVFSFFFNNTQNYPVYVIIGQTIWNFFCESTTMSMHSILVNAALIKKVYIPKLIFPISRVISCFVTMLFSLGAVLIVMIVTRVNISWTLLLVPFVLLCTFLFALGIGCALSGLAVYFRDMVHLYSVITTAWMYVTPIFWTVDILPNYIARLIKLNPLYLYIQYFRDIVLYQSVPSLWMHIACLASGLLSVIIGFAIFKKLEKKFIMYI